MTTIIKQTKTEFPVKQRKNGSWFADLSKIENSVFLNSASKTKRQANGKSFKSVTIISIWDSKPYANEVKIIWNEL